MEDLGKVFRDFRLNGHYSLKEAAGQVCSTSQLSRFELGESDMTLSKFLDLLDNIHVTLENFMDKARNFQQHEHVAMMGKIIPLYYELNWILMQGLICQRDSQFRMRQEDLDKVADYLFQVEDWTMYELILFGNLYSFYDVDYVYRLGKEVMEREDYYKEIGRHKKLVLIIALNCYQHCLESCSFDKASYFEAYVEKIIGKGIKLYERNVFLYLKGFAAYQKGQKKQGIKQMQEAMHIFEVLGLPEQVTYYQEHFDKFVKA